MYTFCVVCPIRFAFDLHLLQEIHSYIRERSENLKLSGEGWEAEGREGCKVLVRGGLKGQVLDGEKMTEGLVRRRLG